MFGIRKKQKWVTNRARELEKRKRGSERLINKGERGQREKRKLDSGN